MSEGSEEVSDRQRWFNHPVSLAVLIVGGLTFCLIIGTIGLLAMDRDAPEGLIAVLGSGMGALATLLVSKANPLPDQGKDDDGLGS